MFKFPAVITPFSQLYSIIACVNRLTFSAEIGCLVSLAEENTVEVMKQFNRAGRTQVHKTLLYT